MFYTRSQLRTALRRRIGDTESITWSDSELDDQLNWSAQAVEISLAHNQLIRHSRASEELTPDGTDTLTIVAPDLHSIIDIRGGVDDVGVEIVDEKAFSRHKRKYRLGNTNNKDAYVAAHVFDDAAIGGFSGGFSSGFHCGSGHKLIFPYNQNAGTDGTFTVYYARIIPPIQTGTDYDTRTFERIPFQYQMLISHHAAQQLLSDENSMNTDRALANFGLMLQDSVQDSRTRTTPARTGS